MKNPLPARPVPSPPPYQSRSPDVFPIPVLVNGISMGIRRRRQRLVDPPGPVLPDGP